MKENPTNADPNTPWGTCWTVKYPDFYNQQRPVQQLWKNQRKNSLKLEFQMLTWCLFGEVVALLADCSTDCDCSKRCSLALTDWDSTVARSWRQKHTRKMCSHTHKYAYLQTDASTQEGWFTSQRCDSAQCTYSNINRAWLVTFPPVCS